MNESDARDQVNLMHGVIRKMYTLPKYTLN